MSDDALMDLVSLGWRCVFSLLLPVGPPLGFGLRDARAWQELVEHLA